MFRHVPIFCTDLGHDFLLLLTRRLDRCVAWLDFDACERPSRGVGSILANSRGARKKASLACTSHRAPAQGAIEHLQHTHIDRHTHAHTHTRVTSETPHVHTVIVYYDSLQLTSSTQEAKEKGHRAHGQIKIMHAYEVKVNTYSSRAGKGHKCNACLRA